MRGRRRVPEQRVLRHPVRVDLVRRHASGRGLRAVASADDEPGAHRDIFAPIFVEITSIVVLTGISPIDFNNDPQQQEAFAQAILGSLPSEHQDAEVTDIVARSARRRRLQAGSVEVSYTIVIEQDDTEDVSDGGASILSDVTTCV